MAVAADDAVDLIRRHAGLVHRPLAGQDGVGTQRLVHRDAVPATVDRRMSDASHRDLAAVLPDAEPVLVSPPLIPLRRAHGSSFPLCSGGWYGRDELGDDPPLVDELAWGHFLER